MNTTFEKVAKKVDDTLFGKINVAGKDEWLTPPYIIKALGAFDLDPCSPINRPWDTASSHYTIADDGLKQEWSGRVWLNPPYGNKPEKWIHKLSIHGCGTALLFARTDTKMFFEYIWPIADAILFLEGRIKFYHNNGKQGKTPGAPSVLIAYGQRDYELLKNSGLKGHFISLKNHNAAEGKN